MTLRIALCGNGQHKETRPVRVLHLIDGLGGGGSERLLWDTIRLSAPEDVIHYVVTMYPDHGDHFVYADLLRARGAYRIVGSPWPLRSLYKLRMKLAANPGLGALLRRSWCPATQGWPRAASRKLYVASNQILFIYTLFSACSWALASRRSSTSRWCIR